jgi:uncharacterized protein YjeT (DUF2065 family)
LSLKFTDLAAALALLFVIDGIVPFLNPGALRRVLTRVLECGDRELRIFGLTSMLLGVALLYLVS